MNMVSTIQKTLDNISTDNLLTQREEQSGDIDANLACTN